MKTFLTIDAAIRTGWCLDPISAGVENLKPRHGSSDGMLYLNFAAWLDRTIVAARPEAVFYEQIMFVKYVQAAQIIFGLVAQLQAVCTRLGIPYQGVTPVEIKKHITGRAGAKKADVIAAIREHPEHGRWFKSGDDNEADARALWSFVQAKWG